jgi:hypothetical protein
MSSCPGRLRNSRCPARLLLLVILPILSSRSGRARRARCSPGPCPSSGLVSRTCRGHHTRKAGWMTTRVGGTRSGTSSALYALRNERTNIIGKRDTKRPRRTRQRIIIPIDSLSRLAFDFFHQHLYHHPTESATKQDRKKRKKNEKRKRKKKKKKKKTMNPLIDFLILILTLIIPILPAS